ncbi:MAG: hypothetical protein LBH73_05630 [Spirochaetaceae bacterium]|jgi:outer membrane protein OmpA-like peptidoglycan-associated protein|nr:hypothetical protein [Spirochaetaceae bacterium]
MRVLFAFLLLFSTLQAFGQEKGSFSLGILGEMNTNTRQGYSFTGGLAVDYGISEKIAAGVRADYGNDLAAISALGLQAFGRYYFFTRPAVFAQLGAGYTRLFEDDRHASTILADGSIGIRFSIGWFYLEPYIRFGWPLGVGGGLVLGYHYVQKPPAPPEPVLPEPVPPEPEEIPPEPEEIPEEPAPEEFFGEDFIETPDGGLLYIPEILFRPNSAEPAGDEQGPGIAEHYARVLHNVFEFLRTHPGYTLLIVGYANPVLGTEEEEETRLIPLSRSRAEFVKDELVRLGIADVRISTFGSGGQGATGDLQRNRRVQFHFVNLGSF